MRNNRAIKETKLHIPSGSFWIINLLLFIALILLTQIKPIDHFKDYQQNRISGNNKHKIYGSNTISQEFDYDPQTDSIEIHITSESKHGYFDLKLYDNKGNELKSWKTDKLDLISGRQGKDGWLYYPFADVKDKCTDHLRIEISAPQLTEEEAIIVYTEETKGDSKTGTCRINGEETNQTLSFSTYKKYSNILFYIAIIVLFITANIWWFNRDKDIQKSAFFILLGTGLIMFFIMAPASQPDETYHYNSAVKLSNIIIGRKENVHLAEDELQQKFTYGHYNANDSYIKLLTGLEKAGGYSGKQTYLGSMDGLNHPLAYLAPALGITIARLFGGNCVQAYTIARLFTLMSYIAMAMMAIRIIPINKELMLLICIVPMAMHQAVSTSRDVLVNGLSLVYFAYILKVIYDGKPFNWKNTFICMTLLAVLGPVKVIYCSLALLILLIPGKQFHNRKDQVIKTLAVIFGILIILYLSEWRSMQHNMTSSTYLGKTDYYHIDYLFKHPFRYVRLILGSIVNNTWYYLQGIIGSKLAGLSVPISDYLVIAYLVVLLLSALNKERSEECLNKPQKIGMLVFFLLGYGLLMAAFSFANTIYGYTQVLGVQGRYLLPFVPALLFGINTKKLSVIYKPNMVFYAVWFIYLGYIVDVMSQVLFA